MSLPSIGFIGGGRIARILVSGWLHAKLNVSRIVICDPDDAAFSVLKAAVVNARVERGTAMEVAQQAIVFLAVHTPKLTEAVAPLAGALNENAIVISLAPKITLAKLRELLGGFGRLARLIPNAPSSIGRGFNPITWSDEIQAGDRMAIRTVLEPLGQLPEVPESSLEAYAILVAMGPTYFWPQWLELESLARVFGLPESQARQALQAMIVGAVELLSASTLTTDQVLDLIPVKPLADFESELRAAYRSRLTSLFEKIRPAV